MIPDNDQQRPDHSFRNPFIATLIGAWIGWKLDQTAFGRWFNTNPVLNRIFTLLRVGLILLIVMGVMYYLWLVLISFTS